MTHDYRLEERIQWLTTIDSTLVLDRIDRKRLKIKNIYLIESLKVEKQIWSKFFFRFPKQSFVYKIIKFGFKLFSSNCPK